LWDLAARRRGVPLWQLLGVNRDRVPVYASGINPEQAEKRMQESRALGYNAFKIKVGFEPAADKAVVRGTLDRLELNEHLMLDANQAWNLATALDMARHLEQGSIDWLEEPMPVDAPDSDWAALSEASPVPLAGGENLAGPVEFDRAVNLGVLSVLQPDVCKWGGISGCFPVARCALDAGRRLCPHYLGGGIGLIASAHLLAAVGGDGLLEVDSNPNPLRQTLTQPFPVINDGYLKLPNGAGLGVEPDLDEAAGWQVLHLDYH
jgi:L-alanine-DL-glutamate epimerase-like enolase superfamily enzyme